MYDYDSSIAFLGDWGLFQKQVFFLLSLTTIPNGLSGPSVVFLTATQHHRCLIPAHANLTREWRNSSIPLEGGFGAPSQCSRYRLADIVSFSVEGLRPGVDVNLSDVATESCLDGWEYEQNVYTSSTVSEWDLVCDDKWKNPLTSSIYYLGIVLGSIISGHLSDRYGRKIVLFVSLAVQTIFTIVLVFSPSWVFFCTIFFIVGVGQSANYVAAFVLGTEILSSRTRKTFSTLSINLFFDLGYMLLPLCAFLTRHWKLLLLVIGLPGLLYVPLWCYIPESPRWLLSQGRAEEAEAIIRDAAKRNKIEPPPTIFKPLQKEVRSEGRTDQNICDLLASQHVRWTSVTLWLVWITVTISYFALSLNTGNLHGDAYLNCFLSALVELPAYIVSWLLFRWCSRRLTLFSNLCLGGLFVLFVQLVPAKMIYLAITLEMLGKFAVTSGFSVVYGYTAEVYPTMLRHTAVGTCTMISRMGSIVSPYFIYLRNFVPSLPYIIIGCLTVTSGLLSLLLPETFGMPLPETIDQMQPFSGSRCSKKTPYRQTSTVEKRHADEETSPNRQREEAD